MEKTMTDENTAQTEALAPIMTARGVDVFYGKKQAIKLSLIHI